MKIFKKALSAVTASIMAASVCVTNIGSLGTVNAADMTAVELVEAMGQGWNLGNTFDSSNTWTNPLTPTAIETAWGNPVTTEAMIKEIKKSGFQTIRIPINWYQMMSNDGSTIDADYVARIKEVMGYCLNNDLYVIINTHHDEDWIKDEVNTTRFKNLWTAISKAFASYDQRVIFEGTNEVNFSSDAKQMEFNQAFVDAVRATGGNNANRLLLVPANNNNTSKALSSSFSAPTDSAKMVAVSVHYYEPPGFCVGQNPSDSWYKGSWGTSSDYTIAEKDLDDLENKFIKNGIPVIIGEYGVVTKTTAKKDYESTKKFLKEIATYALDKEGMCPVLWDMSVQGTVGDASKEGDMYYFDRTTLSWYDNDIKQIFLDAASGSSSGNDKTKSDRITFKASDVKQSDGSILIDLKPYKDLGVTVNNVVINYGLGYSGTMAKSYGAGGAVQYNIVDSATGKNMWACQNYNFVMDESVASVEIPKITEVDGGSGPLDMDYIKIENWWTWTDPKPDDEDAAEAEAALVSYEYGDVTIIFSDYIYIDGSGDTDPPATTTTTTTAKPAETTTTQAVPANAVGNAYLIGQLGGDAVWDSDEAAASQKTANVTGDGQYTVEWDLTEGGTDTVQFLAVVIEPVGSIKTFTTDTFTNLKATLDEVWIDGVKINYTASEDAINTRYYESETGVTRLYLRNDWTSPKITDLASDTEVLESVKVVFTLSGVDDGYIPPSSTTTTEKPNLLAGDANCDGKVTVADAVAILQSIGNKDKYELKPDGKLNADVDGVEGITPMDALVIQQVDAGIYKASDLPLKG